MTCRSPSRSFTGRSPHGERGLKFTRYRGDARNWSRSPHGERGLKFREVVTGLSEFGRSPHGERGLKFEGIIEDINARLSLPARGAWIEIAPAPGMSVS